MTGEEFKQAREKMRLTQADLAKRLDVAPTTVYRWESGKAEVTRTIELALKQIRAELLAEDSA